MLISSNIKQVIARIESLDRGIMAALKRALAVTYWKPRLEHAALKTLRLQWAFERNLQLRGEYERLTPRILSTLSGALTDIPGAIFEMGIPEIDVKPSGESDILAARDFTIAQNVPARGGASANFRLPPDIMQAETANREMVRQAILDWVKNVKVKTERDAGYTDEEIADRLEWILGVHADTSAKGYTPEMEAAAEGLRNRIEEFIGEGQTNGQGPQTPGGGTGPTTPLPRVQIDPAVAQKWLAAVLASWKSLVMASLPERISYEIAKEFHKASTELAL